MLFCRGLTDRGVIDEVMVISTSLLALIFFTAVCAIFSSLAFLIVRLLTLVVWYSSKSIARARRVAATMNGASPLPSQGREEDLEELWGGGEEGAETGYESGAGVVLVLEPRPM